MLRSVCKRLIKRSINPPSNGIKSSCLINQQLSTQHDLNAHRIEKEYNEVTLIGTVCGQVFYNEKSSNFLLSTQHHYQTDNKGISIKANWHKIRITSYIARELLKRKIDIGDRVHLNGKIVYRKLVTQAGKIRGQAVIIANEIFVCGKESDATYYNDSANPVKTVPVDLNEVMLMGRVIRILYQQENFSIFSLITHFNTRDENGDENVSQSHHSILIFDRDLRKTAEDVVEQGKRVIVYGQINYRNELDQYGVKTQSAAIVADRILGIEKLGSYES